MIKKGIDRNIKFFGLCLKLYIPISHKIDSFPGHVQEKAIASKYTVLRRPHREKSPSANKGCIVIERYNDR